MSLNGRVRSFACLDSTGSLRSIPAVRLQGSLQSSRRRYADFGRRIRPHIFRIILLPASNYLIVLSHDNQGEIRSNPQGTCKSCFLKWLAGHPSDYLLGNPGFFIRFRVHAQYTSRDSPVR
jgi:hypothetical protein